MFNFHPFASKSVKSRFSRIAVMLLAGMAWGAVAPAATLTNLFFLHHSTGLGLINGGHIRGVIFCVAQKIYDTG